MNHQHETNETSSLRHSATSSLERLLWTVAETKECFQKYRMWPSFIGLSIDQEKKGSKGKLPVMLWDEQHRYLSEMVAANSSSSSSSSTVPITPSRKRKLSEVDEVAGDDEAELLTPAKKKSRNTFFSTLTNGFHNLTSRVSSVLTGAAQWMFSMGSGTTLGWSIGSSNSSKTFPTTRSGGEKMQGGLKTKRDGDVQMTVFRSLQHQEYFVGPGDVYGGDYTVCFHKSLIPLMNDKLLILYLFASFSDLPWW